MRTINSGRRGLRAICTAALVMFGMALASATAVVGTAYARFIDTGLKAAPGRQFAWGLTGVIQRSIYPVTANQVPERAPVGLLLGNTCYVGVGLTGGPFRDSFNCIPNANNSNNTSGDSRKNDRLNS